MSEVRGPAATSHGVDLPVNPEWEVHPTQVKEWLDKKEDMLLLDVRQPREWSAARIEGAMLVPLDVLEREIPNIEEFEDRRVVIHCKSGRRSLTAAAILRQKGFKQVHSMAGGIEAWSLIVDPKVPRY